MRRGGVLIGFALLVGALGIGAAIGAGVERVTGPPGASRNAPVTSGSASAATPASVEGIPLGYPHTPAGAARAAGNYLAALGGRLALDSGAASGALDRLADPGSRSALQQGLTASLQLDERLWGVETAARQGRPVVLTQTPMAYRVTSYTGQRASVELWLVTSVGVENRQRLAAFFGNATAILTWLDGDWRLQAVDLSNAAGNVVPACLQTPTPTGGVPTKLDGFTPYDG